MNPLILLVGAGVIAVALGKQRPVAGEAAPDDPSGLPPLSEPIGGPVFIEPTNPPPPRSTVPAEEIVWQPIGSPPVVVAPDPTPVEVAPGDYEDADPDPMLPGMPLPVESPTSQPLPVTVPPLIPPVTPEPEPVAVAPGDYEEEYDDPLPTSEPEPFDEDDLSVAPPEKTGHTPEPTDYIPEHMTSEDDPW